MSIYHYAQSGIIDEITFQRTEKGAIRAYLHARPDAGLSTVQDVLHALDEKGMESIPFTLNNRPVLEVRGFKNEEDLTQLLAGHDWVKGQPRIYDEKGDRHSWKDILQKRSLQASGMAMALADIGFTIYGIKESNLQKRADPMHKRDIKDAMAGLSYLSGSTVLTLYGRNDQSQLQIRDLSNMILDYAREKGYSIPQDSAASLLARRRDLGAWQKADKFFRENPSEIGNTMYAVAGSLIASSAVQHRVLKKPSHEKFPDPVVYEKKRKEMLKSGIGDTLLGTSTVASGLLGTLVKEKARDPDAPKSHGFKAILEWIHERPLTIAGAGYMGSTLCHAWTTVVDTMSARDTKRNPASSAKALLEAEEKLKAIPFRGLFIVSTLVGEVLLAISSKGHGEGVVSDLTVDKSAISVAAELIACQPEKDREALIEYMGKFLGLKDVLAMDNTEVIATLREQVNALSVNPWVQCHNGNMASTPPLAGANAANCAVPAWQARLQADKPAGQPQLPS